MGLLVHGLAELHTRQFLLEKILHIGGIDLLNVLGCDKTGLDRHIEERLGCTRTGDDDLIKVQPLILPVAISTVGRFLSLIVSAGQPCPITEVAINESRTDSMVLEKGCIIFNF